MKAGGKKSREREGDRLQGPGKEATVGNGVETEPGTWAGDGQRLERSEVPREPQASLRADSINGSGTRVSQAGKHYFSENHRRPRIFGSLTSHRATSAVSPWDASASTQYALGEHCFPRATVIWKHVSDVSGRKEVSATPFWKGCSCHGFTVGVSGNLKGSNVFLTWHQPGTSHLPERAV